MKRTLQRIFGQGIFYTGWKNAIFSLLLAVGVYFTSLIYDLLNHGPAVLNLHTALDSAIPVVPVFVVPYNSLQPYIYATLILFLLLRTKYFQSACLAMITVWFISYGFYYFLQSAVVRPEAEMAKATDIFSKMVSQVYAGDNRFNDFPSLHTSLSTILAIHWVKVNKPLGIVLSIWTALIVASTLFVKQHYIADMLFGLALAFTFSWLYTKLIVRKPAAA
ncbi:MAG: phosphatase PAP2 family protein [Anaerolineales bacterium]|jgi:membrane-associated phospholipid phosphatase